ncbi:GcrA cell cycle regulator [Roseomonas sp. OT10]|uniref:GcrA family cell cycle regulator n=1 Tax=Roseomonas cutis TaxID=2897332 RepID=UPI001E4E5EA4|nr:GcrA family cell cycle regulator [Roseomonas sp. OT10]UFN50483.1 GcrA cell cycle regulator [Roseomonas sp. OT10]
MEWTAEAIETLQALWAEGHSTAEIGRRMGISKNAVVGKAHRLNLAARPSPIRREGEQAGTESPRRVATPAPAPAAEAPVRAPAAPRPAASPRPQPAAPPAPRAPVAPPAPVVRPFQRVGARTCCWPIGEPGTPEFRFCTAEAAGGRPYCAEHAAIAYVKARDRREDAA